MNINDLRIFTEPQEGAHFDDLVSIAQRAEQLGFGAFFRSDHYLAMGAGREPGPTDAWISLAGLAVATSTIHLGTLVTSATFRLPGPLAISVAGVDHMSNGRVEIGIGAGWFEAEHRAYGIPFPGVGERFDNLTEQLEILTGMWSTPVGEKFNYSGHIWQVADSPALPKPVRPEGIPIIVGGHGKVRTPRLAAKFASEFNVPFTDLDATKKQGDRVRKACERIDRDPATMDFSAAIVVCCGRDEKEFRRRAEAIGRDPQELREQGAAGTVDEVAATLSRWAENDFDRLYLQVLDLTDLDHLDLIAEEVAPKLP